MNTSTLTTTALVNKMIEEVEKNNKNKISKVKLIKKVVFKIGLKLTDESIILDLSKGLDDCNILLRSFKLWDKATDIQKIYDDSSYGHSCMSIEGSYSQRGRMVGEFYAKHGIILASIEGARGLINPQNKSFYRIYGSNWFILKALLIVLGFKENSEWLKGLEIEIITKNENLRCTSTERRYIENNKYNEFGEYAYFIKHYTVSDYLNKNNKDKIKLKNISNNVNVYYNNKLITIINNKIYHIYFDYIINKYYIDMEYYEYYSNDFYDEDDQTPYLDGSGYKFKYTKEKEKFNTYKVNGSVLIKLDDKTNNYDDEYLPKIRSKHLSKYNKKCRLKNKKNKYI